ncbi:glutathione transferase GstA [soil metagenome]
MKLFYSKGACSLATHIIINEIGVACEYELVDLKSKKTADGKDYLLINPKGAVPALQLDTNEILTENAVIQQYLADTHKASTLLPPIHDFKRYRVLEWLNFISADIHKSFGPLFNSQVSTTDQENIFLPNLKKKFDFVDNHLKNNAYLVGDDFTLPDGYLFVMLTWLPKFKIELSTWQSLPRYFAALSNRPSIQHSLAEEGF